MRNILGTEKGRIILPKMKCNSEIFSKFSRRWTSTAEMGENGERGIDIFPFCGKRNSRDNKLLDWPHIY